MRLGWGRDLIRKFKFIARVPKMSTRGARWVMAGLELLNSKGEQSCPPAFHASPGWGLRGGKGESLDDQLLAACGKGDVAEVGAKGGFSGDIPSHFSKALKYVLHLNLGFK
eukprot:1367016-Amorphochlora_amoeboformis.AAC.1